MITFLAFIGVFGILIFVHELGHFLMARRFGVKVLEFGFGFPPRIWSKKKGDTLYTVNLVPIGGFVRMHGEHGEDKKNKESFASKTKFQRGLILIAGVFMNLLLAYTLLTILYAIGMNSMIPGSEKHIGVKNDQRVVITGVEEGSPAAEALKEGDIISKIEGEEVFQHIAVSALINEVLENDKEKPVNITITRDGTESVKELKTYESEIESNGEKVSVQKIGVSLQTEGKIRAPFYLAPVAAFSETIRLTKFTTLGIIDFFGTIITKFKISEGVVGPAGIVSIAGDLAKVGIIPLMQFMIFLSISLAVLNIMPIPALDGGHLLILLVEKVKGKDLSHEAKSMVQFIGFGVLVALMVTLTIRDLTGVSILESIKGLF